MIRRGPMFSKPFVIVLVPPQRPSPKVGWFSLDQPTLAEGFEALRIITMSSKNVDIEEAHRWQVGKKSAATRWTRFTALERLSARPLGHRMTVSPISSWSIQTDRGSPSSLPSPFTRPAASISSAAATFKMLTRLVFTSPLSRCPI